MILLYYVIGIYFVLLVQIANQKFEPIKMMLWPYCIYLHLKRIIVERQY